MFSSLRWPGRRRRTEHSPYSSHYNSPEAARHARYDRATETEHEEAESGEYEGEQEYHGGADVEEGESSEDDEEDEEGPLLPIFSSALDRLPIYSLTHSIRLMVIQRCETTLSWDQLRSPQISQFLIKPIQQEIRATYFSKATLYVLIANCLQFHKEGQASPGNLGVSKTRAMISELLAMRLLKEFSTRDMIDALFYDFDPLQGFTPVATGTNTPRPGQAHPRAARISTVEIAIRAQAKKFLAHPLVVQQLEAIWAGAIVFHSAADNLHRRPAERVIRVRDYGAMNDARNPDQNPMDRLRFNKNDSHRTGEHYQILRKSVTLYDPQDASLFKLSRLRVPRYRQLFSTASFAVMLGLFVAVLAQRSLDISLLEVLFWFWSAGYMLDEIVGFTEQGFGLYIMSVWNAFDLGILILFIVYYVLRLYGILMPDVRKHFVANRAYDVLASTAVLLFPRLFSVLDHYRYFSQLLIAFRMMAQDLVAILILIVISCSGFFVAFTLSFGDEFNGGAIAYALFQMLMGFTPAAWDLWPGYNALGKALLTLFLFICHFLIVTILITVLTNSFMAIVQNANEEHQFLFAVNTISMVKSDALFSYIAPTNIIGWLFTPVRCCIPFRSFVKLNRTVIKLTHFPILFMIFSYERLILSRQAHELTDLVERRGRDTQTGPAFSFAAKANDLFSPGHRLREPSIATFRKDEALEAVFRQPSKQFNMRLPSQEPGMERRRSTTVVDNWMQGMGQEGGAAPPQEQSRRVLDRLEHRRPLFRRSLTSRRDMRGARDFSANTRSAASDPEEIASFTPIRPQPIQEEESQDPSTESIPQPTDADGDDEVETNDIDDEDHATFTNATQEVGNEETEEDSDKENRPVHTLNRVETSDFYPSSAPEGTPSAALPASFSSALRARLMESPEPLEATPRPLRPSRAPHIRNMSTNTILYNPVHEPSSISPGTHASPPRTRPSTPGKNFGSGSRTPKRLQNTSTPAGGSSNATSRPRPVAAPRSNVRSSTNLANLATFEGLRQSGRRDPSFNAVALDLASDLGDNRHRVDVDPLAVLPGSFSTQHMAMAREAILRERHRKKRRSRELDDDNDDDVEGDSFGNGAVGRIMLARLNNLEEGLKDLFKEVKEWRKQDNRSNSDIGAEERRAAGAKKEKSQKRRGLESPKKRPTGPLQKEIDMEKEQHGSEMGYRASSEKHEDTGRHQSI